MGDWRRLCGALLTGLLLLMAGLLIGGCGNSNTWHQKLTVTVDTPEGDKSASSVVSVTLRDTKGYEWMTLPEARGARYELTGEAVVLELAPGRYLFALLKGLPYATNVFFPDEPPVETAPRLAGMRASLDLAPAQYPLLVTFADINDPASVARVDPDDLAASFGEGYALSAITLTITDKTVTKGRVEAVLGWLGDVGKKQANLKGKPEHGLVSEQPDPAVFLISPSDFSTELYK